MKRNHIILFCIALWAVCFSSCEDKTDEFGGDARLFRTRYFSAFAISNSIKAEWNEVIGAKDYTIELSRDSSFSEIEWSVDVDTLGVRIMDLDPETDFVVRLRANHPSGDEWNSKWSIAGTKTGKMSTSIIQKFLYEDIGDNSVVVSWDDQEQTPEPKQPDKIVITRVMEPVGEPLVFTLTSEQLSGKAARCEGLEPSTEYLIKMLAGNVILGVSRITTVEAAPSDAIPVEPGISWNDFKAIVDNCAEGSTLLFRKNEKYCFNTSSNQARLPLLKGLTFMGEPGGKRPVIYLSEITVAAGKTLSDELSMGNIRFVGLELSGVIVEAGSMEENYANTRDNTSRLLDISRTSIGSLSIGAIVFDRCIVRNYWQSVLQVDRANTKLIIGEYKIQDCLVFDIGRDQGNVSCLAYLSSGGGSRPIVCRQFTFTNSTFVGLRKGLIRLRYYTGSEIDPAISGGVTISNCTFDYFGLATFKEFKYGSNTEAQAFIDFQNYPSAIPVTIENTLIGNSCNSPITDPGESDRKVVFYGTNSYRLEDCHLPFKDKLMMYGATSDAVFASPATPERNRVEALDYTIIDEDLSFRGLGDPRWR